MKKVIVILVVLLSLLTSVYASRVSFVVSNEITSFSYENQLNEPILDDKLVSINLSESDIITLTTEDDKQFDAKLVKTDESEIDATFSWDISNTKLRYTLNNSKPKSIKSGVNEITLTNLPSNELSIFTLEAKVNNKWSECGRVGLIPVNVIEDEEQEIIQEEVLTPVINENSSIDTLEPKLISNKEKKVSLRLTASPYSLGIYDFINGHHIEGAKYLSFTNYGLALDGELGYQANSSILLYLGGGYGYQIKKETIIPDAFNVTYLKGYVGLDLRFIKVNNFSSSLGVFTGLMMGVNANTYSINSLLGARVRCDYTLNKHLSFGLQTRLTASYSKAEDKLYSSITYLIDLVALSLDMRF